MADESVEHQAVGVDGAAGGCERAAQTIEAERLSRNAEPLEQPVGEQDQQVARLELEPAGRRREPFAQAEREGAEPRLFDLARNAPEQRERVAGAHVVEIASWLDRSTP